VACGSNPGGGEIFFSPICLFRRSTGYNTSTHWWQTQKLSVHHLQFFMLMMLKEKRSLKKLYANDPEKKKEGVKNAYVSNPEKFKKTSKEFYAEKQKQDLEIIMLSTEKKDNI